MSNLLGNLRGRLDGSDLSGVLGDEAPAQVAPAAEFVPAAEPAASVTPTDTQPAPDIPDSQIVEPAPSSAEVPVVVETPAAVPAVDDPVLAEVRSRFATPEDLKPFVTLVDAAASANPQDFDNGLRDLLGDERYVQHQLHWIEQNRDAIAPLFQIDPAGAAAEFDPELFSPDDDASRGLMVKAQQIAATAEALKLENAQLKAQVQAQAPAMPPAIQSGLDRFESTVTSPLDGALKSANLPAEAMQRVEAEVVAGLTREFGPKLQAIQKRMMAGENPALFGKEAVEIQSRVAELTRDALAYHSRLATPVVAPAVPAKAAAAAATTAVVEPPKAAVAPAPAPAATQPTTSDSLKSKMRARVEAGLAAAGY